MYLALVIKDEKELYVAARELSTTSLASISCRDVFIHTYAIFFYGNSSQLSQRANRAAADPKAKAFESQILVSSSSMKICDAVRKVDSGSEPELA